MTEPHFSDGCTCDHGGEDPKCPHHGYEAVIARLEAENERLASAAAGEGYTGPPSFKVRSITEGLRRDLAKAEAENEQLRSWQRRWRAGEGHAREGLSEALAEADDLLRRLDEWDQMNVTGGDGLAYWKAEIAKTRDKLRGWLASPAPEGECICSPLEVGNGECPVHSTTPAPEGDE